MARKRGNNEGSIVKRKDGRWQGAVTTGRDPKTGKPKRVIFYGRTRQEVAEKLTKALSEVQQGMFVEPGKLTLGKWLEMWLSEYAKPRLRPTTWESYERNVRCHIKPAIGNIPLKQLQPNHLQKLYNSLLASGRADGTGGLSPRSVRYVHAILHEALKQAVREYLIPRNPADVVVPPRQHKKEIKPLTTEQVQHLLASIQQDRLYAAFLLEIGTGLRLGELLALRWEDVDLERGVIQIRQSIVRTKNGLLLQAPKTDRSRRSIVLPEKVVKELRRWNDRQAQEKLLLGQSYQDHGLVFCQKNGQWLEPTNFSKYFGKLLEQAGLPHVRFHDLRHTHATQLLQLGIHVKVVQERLGHSTVTMTLDTYSHVLPGLQEDAAAKLNGVLEVREIPST